MDRFAAIADIRGKGAAEIVPRASSLTCQPPGANRFPARRPGERPTDARGHSHIPKVGRFGETPIVHPGSVGMQAYSDELPMLRSIEASGPNTRYVIPGRHDSGLACRPNPTQMSSITMTTGQTSVPVSLASNLGLLRETHIAGAGFHSRMPM
jgi:hypothetical protein